MAIIIQIAIKLLSKYLHKKENIEEEHMPDSNAFVNKAATYNSKHTVSLGSALFFALVLVGGLVAKFGTRQTRVFFFIPLQITAISVCFPFIIILGNPKLKKEFLNFLAKPFIICLKYYPVNRIYPIV